MGEDQHSEYTEYGKGLRLHINDDWVFYYFPLTSFFGVISFALTYVFTAL